MGLLTFPAVDPAVAARWRASGHWPGRLLDSWLDDAVARSPERTAVVDGSARLSYAGLAERVGAATAGLRALDVSGGDAVSLLYAHPDVAELPRTPTGKVQKFRLRASLT